MREPLTSAGRDGDAGAGDGGVERGLPELRVDPLFVELDQAFADVLAQLLQVVEAGVHGKVVVELRKFLELDLLDGDLKRSVTSSELLAAVIAGERERDGARLARGRAQQPLLEPGDQVPGAELHQLIAALAARERLPAWLAALEVLARERADVVDDNEVAGSGGALRGLEPSKTLAHRVGLLLDLVVRDLGLTPTDLKALVLAELRLRKHADLDRELQRLPLRRKLAEVDLGIPDGDDAGALDRVGVPAGEGVADGFLEHRLAADALDHQRRRHLAAAKTWELELAPELARLLLEATLDLPGGNLDLQAHTRVPELGDGGLHGCWHQRHDTVPPDAATATDTAAPARRVVGVDRSARPPGRGRARLPRRARALPARAGARPSGPQRPRARPFAGRGPRPVR